jgi:hypothetical protein
MTQPTFLMLLMTGLLLPVALKGQLSTKHERFDHQIFFQAGLRDYHTAYRRIRINRLGNDTADIRATNYPVLFLGYRKHFGDLLSVSGSVGYFSRKNIATLKTRTTTYHEHVIGILMTSQIYWLNHKQWRLYSSFGAGLFLEDTSTVVRDVIAFKNMLNRDFQFSPIGFSWGRKWGFTGEYSLGYYGRFQTGVFFRMTNDK